MKSHCRMHPLTEHCSRQFFDNLAWSSTSLSQTERKTRNNNERYIIFLLLVILSLYITNCFDDLLNLSVLFFDSEKSTESTSCRMIAERQCHLVMPKEEAKSLRRRLMLQLTRKPLSLTKLMAQSIFSSILVSVPESRWHA